MREMKDSGIEFIGLIPVNWEIRRMKSLGNVRNGLSYSPQDVTDKENGTLVLRSSNIKNGKLCFTDNVYVSCNIPADLQVQNGDILICSRNGSRELIGKNAIIENVCASFGAFMMIFRCETPNYLYYILNSPVFSYYLGSFSTSTINQLTGFNFCNMKVAYCSDKGEQERITGHLNQKCTEIDSLISDIQSQIEVLEEYKRSVITEAVTKGLDPDVEMRDSGIAWVGDIPEHWITHPLYFYFGERKNKNALGLETNLLSLSYGKIIRKDINSNGGLLPESFNTYNIIEKDDIIIRPTDLQNDKRSLRTGIAREHGIITSAYIAMKAIKAVNPEYFHYLLHAYDVMKVFYNMGNGVRQGLNFSEFSRLMVFEPTIEEQNAIVAYLKEKCDEIDLAIAEKKQQIETIEEYKKSLIFEYVTGKKEVKMNEC